MAQSALGISEHPPSSSAPSRTPSNPPLMLPSLTNIDQHVEQSRNTPPVSDNAPTFSMPLPRLSRSFTMPLPSQLGHLQRPQLSNSISTASMPSQAPMSPGPDELATELADSVQMVIQTLLQISPPQLLDPAKEQLSGCALQVPTPSISALFTSMKMLNFMSKHMASFSPSSLQSPPPLVEDEFDVGELLQSVGDALSGVAAEAGVDLVIFHADSSLKDLRIKTDECGLIYSLSYIARQILNSTTRGDVLEIGLRLAPEPGTSSVRVPATLEANEPLFCTFEFKHKSARQAPIKDDMMLKITPRETPNLQTNTMTTLLQRLQADIVTTPSSQLAPSQTKYDLIARVRRADQSKTPNMSEEEEAIRQPFPDLRLAREPSVTELIEFARTLKGRKATFHASTRSSFAHYLTIYLTGWGMDVTHVPTDTGLSTPPPVDMPITDATTDSQVTPSSTKIESVSEPEKLLVPTIEIPVGPPFTIIDDDVNVLKMKMSEFDHPLHLPPDTRLKRPSLAEHHRPKSFLARRAIGASGSSGNPLSLNPVIVYFTSLSNYREVKDLVQATTTPKKDRKPEIIVIPKPAGVRRFLTALYTATTKPLVDPVFFSPIATSPMSPAGRHVTPFFAPPSQSPGISESSLAPSIPELVTTAFSSGEATPVQSLATSPMSTGGYFEREGNKIAGSASSGLFVKSPDGRTGIFFQPFATLDEPNGSLHSDGTGNSLASSVAESAASQARALIGDASPISLQDKPLNGHGQSSESAMVEQARLSFPSLHPSPPIMPNSLGGVFGDPVFERGSVVVKPAKPTKASIVGAKAKKQTETVVPPISVLIVEDNAIQRTILSTFMKNKHISYGIAENGEEAVKQWEKGNYHLVLMDIQMPVMDGIDATKKIREIELARHRALGSFTPQSEGPPTPTSATSGESHHPSTPFHSSVIIVALTAQSSTQDRVAALAAGCNDFLSKPVKLQWLERKIIEWGSIKALQMWADPEVEPLLHKRQQASAQVIADNLHIGRLAKGASSQHIEKS